MFYYESMFNTALNGIVSAGLMSTVLTVAYGILLASLLFSAYEAWTKGGDVRALGVAGVKYLALGALFINDGAVFASNADKNPTLTIMALAWRASDHILARLRRKEL